MVATCSAMPCRPDEELAQGHEQPNAVTSLTMTGPRDQSNTENSEENDSDAESDDDCVEQPYSTSANPEKRKRPP
jgi:hypothetical protein